MTNPSALSNTVSVGPQLSMDDLVALGAQGFTSVINNRPDDEEPGQISSTDLEMAARAAGLDFHHIPIRGLPHAEAVSAVGEVLKSDAANNGRTIMFCRSGMRSAACWAMAQRLAGSDADHLRAAAAAAGYDLSRLPL